MGTFLVWIVVGLTAGGLASAVLGGGFGVVGDIVVGVVGSCVGGILFRALHLRVPFHGLASTVFVALVGAILSLLILRVLHRGSPRVR